jgi:hypothetical protein
MYVVWSLNVSEGQTRSGRFTTESAWFAAVVDDVVEKKRAKTKGEQDVVFAPSELGYTWKER